MENETKEISGNKEEVATEATRAEAETQAEAKVTEAKTLTQEDVNRIVGERLSRQEKQFYEALGVKDKSEFASIKERFSAYDTLVAENKALKEAKAFRENGIAQEREEDAKAFLSYKGLEITAENIAQALSTHPEWKGAEAEAKSESQAQVVRVGAGKSVPPKAETEDEYIKRVFFGK